MTRTWLPLLSCTVFLAACTGRGPDGNTTSTSEEKKETVKIVARPFAWPLQQAPLATRGGTSTGAPVTLSPAPSQAWKDLVAMPAGIDRDRAAIKAMAGEYRIAFDFQETIGLRPGYELSAPYFSWATERIWVIEDTPTRIVLQHQLVMRFAGHGEEPVVIKHWRQDWTWQDRDLLRYRGRATWRHEKLTPEEAAGTWSQAVYGVGDEPRYENYGRWSHDGEMSSWTGDRTWRPRPRREKTVRKDYDVIEGSHRITITTDGWVLWQDNRKLKLADDGTPLRDGLIATEIGLERYQRLDGFDWKPGITLWEQEQTEWAAVRDTWNEVLASDNIRLSGEETVGMALMEAVAGDDAQAGPKAVKDSVIKP